MGKYQVLFDIAIGALVAERYATREESNGSINAMFAKPGIIRDLLSQKADR